MDKGNPDPNKDGTTSRASVDDGINNTEARPMILSE
jgi:hypothetical protein